MCEVSLDYEALLLAMVLTVDAGKAYMRFRDGQGFEKVAGEGCTRST